MSARRQVKVIEAVGGRASVFTFVPAKPSSVVGFVVLGGHVDGARLVEMEVNRVKVPERIIARGPVTALAGSSVVLTLSHEVEGITVLFDEFDA